MKRFLAIFAVILLLGAGASGALAQHVTIEEARAMVLKKFPGKLLEENWLRDDELLFFQFRIEQKNGTIAVMTFDPYKTEMTQMRIERLGNVTDGSALPPALVPATQVQDIVRDYINRRDKSIFDTEITQSDYTLDGKRPVYKVRAAKGAKSYDITIDASTGEIITAR